MRPFAVSLITGVNYFILFYYGLVNLVYTILLLVSMVVILRYIRRIRYSPFKDLVTSDNKVFTIRATGTVDETEVNVTMVVNTDQNDPMQWKTYYYRID